MTEQEKIIEEANEIAKGRMYATKALIECQKELEQYRAIGTVETVITRLVMLEKYESIDTIENLQALKEKSVAKKPEFNVYDDEEFRCPNCHTRVSGYEETIHFCFDCGQHLDWE